MSVPVSLKTVVVFESLAYKDKEVAVHTDIADEGQTIYFPEIKTTATDAASGTHYAKPEKELTLTDLVEYKNLIPGKEYKLTLLFSLLRSWHQR